MKTLLSLLLAASLASPAFAFDAYTFKKLLNYQIAYVGNVTGWYDKEHKDKAKSKYFEGCDYGRKIFIDDRYEVTCDSYGYYFEHYPDVIIFSNGYSKKNVNCE